MLRRPVNFQVLPPTGQYQCHAYRRGAAELNAQIHAGEHDDVTLPASYHTHRVTPQQLLVRRLGIETKQKEPNKKQKHAVRTTVRQITSIISTTGRSKANDTNDLIVERWFGWYLVRVYGLIIFWEVSYAGMLPLYSTSIDAYYCSVVCI